MKFFNCLIIALIFTTIIACEKDNPKIDIRGDWYTIQYLSYSSDDIVDFTYREDYFTDSLIYTHVGSGGDVDISPTRFYIKNDSLFVSYEIVNSNYDYKGKIKMVLNDHFIVYSDFFEMNFYRLIDKSELLSNYIINTNSNNPKFSDSDKTFTKAFQKRSNELYFKIKDTINE